MPKRKPTASELVVENNLHKDVRTYLTGQVSASGYGEHAEPKLSSKRRAYAMQSLFEGKDYSLDKLDAKGNPEIHVKDGALVIFNEYVIARRTDKTDKDGRTIILVNYTPWVYYEAGGGMKHKMVCENLRAWMGGTAHLFNCVLLRVDGDLQLQQYSLESYVREAANNIFEFARSYATCWLKEWVRGYWGTSYIKSLEEALELAAIIGLPSPESSTYPSLKAVCDSKLPSWVKVCEVIRYFIGCGMVHTEADIHFAQRSAKRIQYAYQFLGCPERLDDDPRMVVMWAMNAPIEQLPLLMGYETPDEYLSKWELKEKMRSKRDFDDRDAEAVRDVVKERLAGSL